MSKLASFLVGMGGGYLKADRQRSEDERRAKLDARDQQLHEAKMQEIIATQAARQEDADFKTANRVAMSAGKTDGGYQITDAAGSNAFTKDLDAAVALGDMAATKNTDMQAGAATRVSTGRTGATMQGTVAGSQVFQDPIKAQEFAKTQTMSDWAKMKARQEVADEFGKMELSDDIRGKLLKLESEGAFNAYQLALNGDNEGAAKVYQSTGQNRLPEGAFFTSAEVEDPATKIKRRVVSVMGKDGQPIVPDLDRALRSYLSPEARYNMERNDRKDVGDAKKDEADIALKKSHSAYYTTMADVAGRKVDAITGGVSELDSIALKNIADERKYINQAIIKAQAEGQYNPSDKNTQALTTQLAALTLKERQITSRYTNTAAPDPLNMRKPSTSEAQMRVQATGGMGADPKAIQREIDKTTVDIGKVTDPQSKAALQAYLADLQRQLGNLPAPEQQIAAKPPALPPPVVPPKVPGVTMAGTVAVGSKAPVRSTDGGRTWQLDVPEKIRDPSVSYYKMIPNPVLSALGGKTFTTRQEAERAYQAATKQPA